jgi:hypothetical protein
MGGLMTIVKVRDGITSYGDPGWYENPPGTEPRAATPSEIARDGIGNPSIAPNAKAVAKATTLPPPMNHQGH